MVSVIAPKYPHLTILGCQDATLKGRGRAITTRQAALPLVKDGHYVLLYMDIMPDDEPSVSIKLYGSLNDKIENYNHTIDTFLQNYFQGYEAFRATGVCKDSFKII